MEKIELKADAIEMAKQFLGLMGVDRYLLFQDLDGLALALVEKHSLDATKPPLSPPADHPSAGERLRLNA